MEIGKWNMAQRWRNFKRPASSKGMWKQFVADNQWPVQNERMGLKPGGLVEPGVTHYGKDDDLGDFIYEKTVDGKKKYELSVRKTKDGKRTIVYNKQLDATPENLKLLQDIRAEKFSDLIASKLSNEKYLELRNLKKDLSSREFAKYLNTETNYKPIGDAKWNRKNIDKRSQSVGFTSDVYRISDDVKKSVFADYQKQVKAGKTNLRELARTHFPDSSIPLETRQKRIYSILTKDYGVDRSVFKTEFDPESKYRSKQTVRFKRNKTIQEALNKAGKVTKAQYLKLESQILDLNKNILNMSDQEILNNKTLMRALNVDASVENLNKGKITFDKYTHLSKEDQVAKIRQLAKANTFFQPEHIAEVVTGKQSIVYPNNLQVASGKIGSYMSNIKKYVKDNPNGKAIPSIEKFLNEFDLAVKEGEKNLGVKNIVYNSKTGTSNIVDMASAKITKKFKIPVSGGQALHSFPANIPGMFKKMGAIPRKVLGFFGADIGFYYLDKWNEMSKGKSEKEAAATALSNATLGVYKNKTYIEGLEKTAKEMGIDPRAFENVYKMNEKMAKVQKEHERYQGMIEKLNKREASPERDRTLASIENAYKNWEESMEPEIDKWIQGIVDDISISKTGGIASPLELSKAAGSITDDEWYGAFGNLQKASLEKLRQEKAAAYDRQSRQVDPEAGKIGNILNIFPFSLSPLERAKEQGRIDDMVAFDPKELYRYNLDRGLDPDVPITQAAEENLMYEHPGLGFNKGGRVSYLDGGIVSLLKK